METPHAPHGPDLLRATLAAIRVGPMPPLQVMAELTFNDTFRLKWPLTICAIPLQQLVPPILVLVTEVTTTICLWLSLAGMFNLLNPVTCPLITVPRTLEVSPTSPMPQAFGLSYFLKSLFVLPGRTLPFPPPTTALNLSRETLESPVVLVNILAVCLLGRILRKFVVRPALERMVTILDVVTRPPNANALGQSAESPVPIMSANVVADPTILVPSRPLVTLVVFRFLSMANLILLQFGFGQLVTVADRPSWSLCYVTSPAMLKQLLLTSRVMTVTVTTTLSTCPCP